MSITIDKRLNSKLSKNIRDIWYEMHQNVIYNNVPTLVEGMAYVSKLVYKIDHTLYSAIDNGIVPVDITNEWLAQHFDFY